jgi:hypothetical protein
MHYNTTKMHTQTSNEHTTNGTKTQYIQKKHIKKMNQSDQY